MPVERCYTMGRRGHKWGKSGICYVGAGSEGKAEREGLARKRGEYDKPVRDSEFVPPKAVRDNAKLGLKLRKEKGRGGLSSRQAGVQGVGSGVVRARNLRDGVKVSKRTIKRMVAFFARFRRFEEEKGGSKSGGYWGDNDNPSASYVAYLLWGGLEGKEWAQSLLARLEKK